MRARTRIAGLTLGAICTCTDRADAQSAPFLLPVGQRVMLEYRDSVRLVPIGFNRHRLVGELLADTGATYRLRLPTGDVLNLQHAAVTRAWASRGNSRVRSAVALGVTFALSGIFIAPRDRTRTGLSREQNIGVAVGAGVGAVLGAVRPFEMWRRVRR